MDDESDNTYDSISFTSNSSTRTWVFQPNKVYRLRLKTVVLIVLLSCGVCVLATAMICSHILTYNTSYNIPVQLQPFSNKSYILLTDMGRTWIEAELSCSFLNAHLVTIETYEEQSAILDFLNLNKGKCIEESYWIGLTDYVNEGKYIWTGSGQEAQFYWWACNQPDLAAPLEQCVELSLSSVYNGKWNDRRCEDKIFAICEF